MAKVLLVVVVVGLPASFFAPGDRARDAILG